VSRHSAVYDDNEDEMPQDVLADREDILAARLPAGQKRIVFDRGPSTCSDSADFPSRSSKGMHAFTAGGCVNTPPESSTKIFERLYVCYRIPPFGAKNFQRPVI